MFAIQQSNVGTLPQYNVHPPQEQKMRH